jgi:hypothetical protein
MPTTRAITFLLNHRKGVFKVLLQTQSAVERLPEVQEWWTPADLAEHLHLTPNAITYHCRRLFPHHEAGHRYRLTYEQAQRVYNYVRKFGCKRSSGLQGSI